MLEYHNIFVEYIEYRREIYLWNNCKNEYPLSWPKVFSKRCDIYIHCKWNILFIVFDHISFITTIKAFSLLWNFVKDKEKKYYAIERISTPILLLTAENKLHGSLYIKDYLFIHLLPFLLTSNFFILYNYCNWNYISF